MDKKQAERNRNYLAGVAMLTEMLDKGLIDEADYSALETEYAAKFLPLFRYEKPCFSSTLLIRQTGEGAALPRLTPRTADRLRRRVPGEAFGALTGEKKGGFAMNRIIHKITPAVPKTPKLMNVAAYARVSIGEGNHAALLSPRRSAITAKTSRSIPAGVMRACMPTKL